MVEPTEEKLLAWRESPRWLMKVSMESRPHGGIQKFSLEEDCLLLGALANKRLTKMSKFIGVSYKTAYQRIRTLRKGRKGK